MTALLLDRPIPVAAEPHRPRGDGRKLTLEEHLENAWITLRADGAADCPVCHARMTLNAGAGDCAACGAQLS